jgi:hypothetical protein
MVRIAQSYLPLSREVTVTRWDSKQERIESSEFVGCNNLIIGFEGGIHLREHFLRKGLRDSVAIDQSLVMIYSDL